MMLQQTSQPYYLITNLLLTKKKFAIDNMTFELEDIMMTTQVF